MLRLGRQAASATAQRVLFRRAPKASGAVQTQSGAIQPSPDGRLAKRLACWSRLLSRHERTCPAVNLRPSQPAFPRRCCAVRAGACRTVRVPGSPPYDRARGRRCSLRRPPSRSGATRSARLRPQWRQARPGLSTASRAAARISAVPAPLPRAPAETNSSLRNRPGMRPGPGKRTPMAAKPMTLR